MGLFDEIHGAANCAKCGRAIEIQIKERHLGSFSEWKFKLGQKIPRVDTSEYTAEGIAACACAPNDFLVFDVLMRDGAAVSVSLRRAGVEGA